MFKVITFNLRYDRPDPGKRNWAVRKTAIAAVINFYQPDLVGTQELKPNQCSDLQALLPDYQNVGGDRRGDGTDEHCSIFYRTQTMNCLETRDFYLSDTPEIAGSITASWGNYVPRMATWGRFQVNGITPPLILVNTHFPHLSAKAQERSAALLVERCRQFALEDAYLLITGDFNTVPNSKPRQLLKQNITQIFGTNLYLNDAIEQLPPTKQMTYHEFTGVSFKSIDTIYYDCRLKLQSVDVNHQQWQGIFPSDHCPLITTLLLADT